MVKISLHVRFYLQSRIAKSHCKITLQKTHCKIALQNHIAKLHFKIALQNCIAKLHCKIALWNCIAKLHCKIALQNCIAKLHCKIALLNCIAKLHCKIALQNCIEKLHCKIALQNCNSFLIWFYPEWGVNFYCVFKTAETRYKIGHVNEALDDHLISSLCLWERFGIYMRCYPLMRLHHSRDVSTYKRYNKLMCFV
jgi:hypothetical protein